MVSPDEISQGLYLNNMNYTGTIIEESLENKNILEKIRITNQKVEVVNKMHRTPWVRQWTLDSVEIEVARAEEVANILSSALDSEHPWYADYKNEKWHYIIFKKKIFKIDRNNKQQYDDAKEYGLSLGIPEYQVDFHPEVAEWER